MTAYLGAEIGLMAGACGLLLVTYWDDISSAFGAKDGAGSCGEDDQDDDQMAEDPQAGDPETLRGAEDPSEQSFSKRLVQALDLGEFRLGKLEPGAENAVEDTEAEKAEAESVETTSAEPPAEPQEAATGVADGTQDPATFLLADSLDEDGFAVIRDFDPATEVITLQYDAMGSDQEPEISISPSEDGESSEIRVNGEPRGLVEGVRDLDASQVALVDVGETEAGV
jgi:hypothetical protein